MLTASVVVVELATGRITYANAGHPPAVLTDGDQAVVLDQTGPLVGAFPATWETHEAELPPGWTLLAHTDGLTDTIGADRERFGDDRLRTCLTTAEPVALLEGLHEAAESFRVGDRSDDLTAIAIHRAGPETPVDDHAEPAEASSSEPADDHAALPPTPGNGTITP
ncbi:MAG: PP2C family protein-serine/threonine phosphatase [Ilumatobacteraceae bacterium]